MKWSIKIVYDNKTNPTVIKEGEYEDLLKEVEESIKDDPHAVGLYFSKIKE